MGTGLVCLVCMTESRGKSLQTIHREFDESLHVKVISAIGRGWIDCTKKRDVEEPKRLESTGTSISELSNLEKARQRSS